MDRLGPWYHSIDLGGGVVTPGRTDPMPKFSALEPHLPDLDGLRVLDLGCNAGGVAVEFARRGARVTGVETTEAYYRQARYVARRLRLRNFRPRHMTVYDVGRFRRRFDIVLCLGLVYHLRHPQLAIDTIAKICEGVVFVSTPVVRVPQPVMESRLPEDTGAIRSTVEATHNWWFPSESALIRMMAVAGFADIERIGGSDTQFTSSSPRADNSSAYPTGTLLMKAYARPRSSTRT